MPMMKSPFDQTIQSPDGMHTILVTANEPIWIPPKVERYARTCRMELVGDAPPAPVAAPVETKDNDDEDEFSVQLDQAILRILTRNEDSDYKNDGTPKVNCVIAEMDPDVRRPTATEVSEAYQRLQENVNLAE